MNSREGGRFSNDKIMNRMMSGNFRIYSCFLFAKRAVFFRAFHSFSFSTQVLLISFIIYQTQAIHIPFGLKNKPLTECYVSGV
jgi:hypothetical protein